MKQIIRTNGFFIGFLLLISIFYIWGIHKVPFHPDESTQIFMSSDFETLFKKPSSMFWDEDKASDSRQLYRELDAPLTKYFIGFGRWIFGLEALPVDWNWSKSWEDNINAGAYPNPQLSRIARSTVAILLPLSLIFIYLIGKQIHSKMTGNLAAILLGTNAVIMLHCRRAMAECVLLFGITFGTWCILKADKRPFLAGLGFAFAFNAKQSALMLLPAFLVALVWLPGKKNTIKIKAVKNLAIFSIIFVIISLILNPIYWQNTKKAVRSAIQARTTLMQNQIEENRQIAPEKTMDSFEDRIFVLMLNLFISPPEYGLIENLAPTQEDLSNYLAIPGHNLFRGIIWGGLFFTLTFFGIYSAFRDIFSTQSKSKRDLILLIVSTFSLIFGLVSALQIYWIRYTIPLIPFISLWMAYGLTALWTLRKRKISMVHSNT